VLTPDEYRIVAVSDVFLEATMTRRSEIFGRSLFEVFPDDPNDPAANGSRNLRLSLQRVGQHGMTDIMPMQRYPIRRPDEQGGGFEERYWNPVNTPVKNTDGSVIYIIHRIEDVTEFVR